MDFRLNRVTRIALIFAMALLSATAYYASMGLTPRWWPIWLAPLPLLLLAPRLSARTASALTFVAITVGGLNMWQYHQELQFPTWLLIASLLGPAAVFAGAVASFRAFFVRGKTWLAILVFPAVIVSAEYLISLSQGSFGSIGYTQLVNLPILQLAALTGLWGITFVVMLFPAAMAAIALSPMPGRLHVGVAIVAFLLCTYGYGFLRLKLTPASPQSASVALVSTEARQYFFPEEPNAVMTLMHAYAEQVQTLAAQGAHYVVLPEMSAIVTDSLVAQIDALFTDTARTASVQVVLGVLHVGSGPAYNEARVYSPAGDVEAVYHKHNLVPVAEGRTTPGTEISVLSHPDGKFGIEICRDMDYPEPTRSYAAAGVGLLFAPAWEFGGDRVSHGHMAIMRGVEDGLSIVRSAKAGLMTVSDDRGRILAEAPSTPEETISTISAVVPVRHDDTLYQHWGDWFAWLNMAGLASALGFAGRSLTRR